MAALLEWLRDNRELAVLKLDGVELRDLKFPNSEAYRGGWKDSRVCCLCVCVGGGGHRCRCRHPPLNRRRL